MEKLEVSFKDLDFCKSLLRVVNKILKDERCPKDLKDDIAVVIKKYQNERKNLDERS
ncbi:MAG TPA: hypothetical protein VHO71_04715 [Caproiciproducens sp.]|nr:hypothetical protein [Caproiciproducens sp.]